MEFYQELVLSLLRDYEVKVSIPDLKGDVEKILENKCYQTLMKIKDVLSDPCIDDADCFLKMDEIIRIFEKSTGSYVGRHDY